MASKPSFHHSSGKWVIRDALNQCLEDYLASAEDAMARHANDGNPTHVRRDAAVVLEKTLERIEMIKKALAELT